MLDRGWLRSNIVFDLVTLLVIDISLEYKMRPAVSDDARDLARLIAISSDGIAVIEWQEQARKEQCDALDVAERLYQVPQQDYSYSNATMTESDGKIAGMLLAFAMPSAPPRNSENRPGVDDENVFAPFIYLEEPNSWYICGVAFYPQHRGKGLGTQLMELGNEQAKENGFSKLSLIALEQNTGAVRLYERLGYEVVDSAPIVPHPMIHYVGDALLMTRPVI
jgi:ribosomal protein S18 acetylase RimI-like enzyme